MARYRLIYDDFEIYRVDGFEGWDALPKDGIVAVVDVWEKNGKPYANVHMGHDFYGLTPDGVVVSNNDERTNSERYPGISLKRGRWIKPELMEGVNDICLAERVR